jgi:TRAP transporter TAXI family solute receptor
MDWRGFMRIFLLSISILLALGSSVTVAQSAEEMQFFRIGTGGVTGTYYPIGGMIAHAISNPPGDRPCEQGGSCGPSGLIAIAQSSNGSVANVKGIQRGSLESGFAQSDIAYWAYTGTGGFSNDSPLLGLRSIANLYPESIHIVVRKGSGIKKVRDLIGKRVSLDEPGSGTLIDAELVLSEYGISREDLEVEFMKPDLAMKRIRANKLDAFFIVAGYPTKAVAVLAADSGVNLLPIDGVEAARLVARYRYFSRNDIPEGVYAGVPRIETISVGAQWIVSSSTDAELVYQITKSLWHQNTRRLLDSGHVKGQRILLETALEGLAVPLHSGAKRFYDEIGTSVE